MLNCNDAKNAANRTRISLKMADDRVITCEKCESNDDCKYAFDPYNTDGDCLALK